MRVIDITSILGPDLKSRVAVQDLLLFAKNTGEAEVTFDFSKVKFATRSFIDEFYNVFVKDGCEFPAQLTNVPEDIAYIIKVVSTTQNKPKHFEKAGNVTYCATVEEFINCLASL